MKVLVITLAALLCTATSAAAAPAPMLSSLNEVRLGPSAKDAISVSPAVAQAASQRPGALTEGSALTNVASPIGSPVPSYVCGDGECSQDGSLDYYDVEDDRADGTLGYYDYSAKRCWFWTLWVEWGVFPYQNRISNDTYWCSMYGSYVSYRSSHVRLGKSVCTAGGANNQHIGGGIGQWYMQTRSSGTFSCGLPYIGGVNIDRWMDTLWRADGAAYFTGYS
jgi:hypothetical protein